MVSDRHHTPVLLAPLAFAFLLCCLIAICPHNAFADSQALTKDAPSLTNSPAITSTHSAKKAATPKMKTKNMKLGQAKTYRLSDSVEYDEVSIYSSNPKVVQSSLCFDESGDSYDSDDYTPYLPEYYMLFARGFGTSIITVSYWNYVSFEESSYYADLQKRFANRTDDYDDEYYDDSGEDYESAYDSAYEAYEDDKKYGALETYLCKEQCYKVKVKSGLISASSCDGLFTGKKYSFNGLFKNLLYRVACKASDDVPYDSSGDGSIVFSDLQNPKFHKSLLKGKFIKGKGYKVVNKGKKIVFTKAGKVTLRYKLNGKVYKIVCNKVHSLPTFKKRAIAQIKRELLVPSSMKVTKTSLHYYSEYGLYYLDVAFSAKNAYGTRVMNYAEVSFNDNIVTVDWD